VNALPPQFSPGRSFRAGSPDRHGAHGGAHRYCIQTLVLFAFGSLNQRAYSQTETLKARAIDALCSYVFTVPLNRRPGPLGLFYLLPDGSRRTVLGCFSTVGLLQYCSYTAAARLYNPFLEIRILRDFSCLGLPARTSG